MLRNKWKIQQELKRDKYQYKLCEKGIKPNTNLLARETTINFVQNVFCPFCLHKDSLNKFVVNKRLGKCPECKNGMLIKTLLRMLKWKPTNYAEFVYAYPNSKFWQKCKFNTWKKRLYHLNMANDFWLQYKYLKEQDSYTEYWNPENPKEEYERFKQNMKNRGIELE